MENEPGFPIRSFSDTGFESKKRVTLEAQESIESSHKRMKLGPPQAQVGCGKTNLLYQDSSCGSTQVEFSTSDHEEFKRGHLDLNFEDSYCAIKQPWIAIKQLKVRNSFENERIFQNEERNSLKIWEEMMRQHASVSSYHVDGSNKHSKDAILRRNIELAKKVKLDSFARLAAPSVEGSKSGNC